MKILSEIDNAKIALNNEKKNFTHKSKIIKRFLKLIKNNHKTVYVTEYASFPSPFLDIRFYLPNIRNNRLLETLFPSPSWEDSWVFTLSGKKWIAENMTADDLRTIMYDKIQHGKDFIKLCSETHSQLIKRINKSPWLFFPHVDFCNVYMWQKDMFDKTDMIKAAKMWWDKFIGLPYVRIKYLDISR